ncbi:MAG: hypothetical protein H0X38_09740 [Planctomycetes bacterium]|nr:hypothetical protein [Planctomycetota bacterium]
MRQAIAIALIGAATTTLGAVIGLFATRGHDAATQPASPQPQPIVPAAAGAPAPGPVTVVVNNNLAPLAAPAAAAAAAVEPVLVQAAVPRTVVAPPAADALAGSWALRAIIINGVSTPMDGEMTLERADVRTYRFASEVRPPGVVPFFYRGTIRRDAGVWFTAITTSNDPACTPTPVATEIIQDGDEVTMRSVLAGFVWRRR